MTEDRKLQSLSLFERVSFCGAGESLGMVVGLDSGVVQWKNARLVTERALVRIRPPDLMA
jgi:hypothetical protein